MDLACNLKNVRITTIIRDNNNQRLFPDDIWAIFQGEGRSLCGCKCWSSTGQKPIWVNNAPGHTSHSPAPQDKLMDICSESKWQRTSLDHYCPWVSHTLLLNHSSFSSNLLSSCLLMSPPQKKKIILHKWEPFFYYTGKIAPVLCPCVCVCIYVCFWNLETFMKFYVI